MTSSLKVKIIIVDDEYQARATLRKLLQIHCPNVDILGEAGSSEQAKVLLKTYQPDLLLLDINLGQNTGFDLLNDLTEQAFQIAFTTAYDEFALKAFQYHAIDYLLKPINPDALAQLIERVRQDKGRVDVQHIPALLQSLHKQSFDQITVSTIEGTSFLLLKNIVRLEADRSYTTFYLKEDKKVMVSRNIKEFEDILPIDQFFRIHQSHIINLHYVDMIVKKEGGYVLMRDETTLPISRRRKGILMDLLNRRSLNYLP